MALTLFFSWQGDTPDKVGRTFLKDVLEDICKELSVDKALNSRGDIAVDCDTQGVAGHVPVADTILEKIDRCSIFAADMTLVGKLEDGERVPNPNVLIEYGRAIKVVGNKRVICLMNTAYGEPDKRSMPFNLRHLRFPIQYNLPEDAAPELKKRERKLLAGQLKEAIQISLETLPAPVVEPPPEFPAAKANEPPARFRKPGESLGFEDQRLSFGSREVFLHQGAAMWLRIMPARDLEQRWTVRELTDKAMNTTRPLVTPLVWGHPGCSVLRAEDGFGVFQMHPREQESRSKSIKTESVVFVFRTGEIWTIDISTLRPRPDVLVFRQDRFIEALQNYGAFLFSLGIKPPYRWEAGLVGVKGRFLNPERYAPLGTGDKCVADQITGQGLYSPDQNPTEVLHEFFMNVLENCGAV
jgi:hypothetical protein